MPKGVEVRVLLSAPTLMPAHAGILMISSCMTTNRYIIFLIILSALSVFSSYMYFRNSEEPVKELSPKTIRHINEVVLRHSDVIASMSVTLVNLDKNERFVIYTSTNIPELEKLIKDGLTRRQVRVQPLFTQNEEYNIRIVRILNGEFVCRPYNTTVGYTDIPGTGNYVSVVCSRAIPPGFGEFKGVVSVFLKKQPTQSQIDHLRSILSTTALLIYSEDLN